MFIALNKITGEFGDYQPTLDKVYESLLQDYWELKDCIFIEGEFIEVDVKITKKQILKKVK